MSVVRSEQFTAAKTTLYLYTLAYNDVKYDARTSLRCACQGPVLTPYNSLHMSPVSRYRLTVSNTVK